MILDKEMFETMGTQEVPCRLIRFENGKTKYVPSSELEAYTRLIEVGKVYKFLPTSTLVKVTSMVGARYVCTFDDGYTTSYSSYEAHTYFGEEVTDGALIVEVGKCYKYGDSTLKVTQIEGGMVYLRFDDGVQIDWSVGMARERLIPC